MFLIYINDISLNLSCKTTLFVDDTSLSKKIANSQVCELELQNDLKTIETLAEKWKIPLVHKSQMLYLFQER